MDIPWLGHRCPSRFHQNINSEASCVIEQKQVTGNLLSGEYSTTTNQESSGAAATLQANYGL